MRALAFYLKSIRCGIPADVADSTVTAVKSLTATQRTFLTMSAEADFVRNVRRGARPPGRALPARALPSGHHRKSRSFASRSPGFAFCRQGPISPDRLFR
jgi:hypothetical protein